MRKIAMLNQKGGVGKTTSVANIAAALAMDGARVIVADFDPQAHLTIHLGEEPETIEMGTYKVLTGAADFSQAITQVRPNLWLLGANINLVGAESELVSVVGRETIFREAIAEAEDKFDFMIIDCPPSLGLLTLNSLAAVDEVIIPLQPHFLALQGLGKLLQTISLVSKRINPALKVSGILFCMFDTRTSLSQEVQNDIQNFLDNARNSDCPWKDAEIIPTRTRRNIKLAEAPSYGKTIFEYEPDCHGSQDYRQIARYLRGTDIEQPETVTPSEPKTAAIPIQSIDSQAAETNSSPIPQSAAEPVDKNIG